MKYYFGFFSIILFAACSSNKMKSDASGTFEADEVIVSAEVPGRILNFDVVEGANFKKGSVVGAIDSVTIALQKEQVQASIAALSKRTSNVEPTIKLLQDQLLVQESQLKTMEKEKARTENLVKQDAATTKQLDDINAQIDVLNKQAAVTRQQINVQKGNFMTQNRGIMSESEPLKKRVAQLNDQLDRTSIVNPVEGTVISKYAEAGEVVSTGKALYKIADLSYLNLRAYLTGDLLPSVKLGQKVTVLIDDPEKEYRKYEGTITWISDKAEFTPKTIQTKEERANFVYAIKVRVKNDGFLKIGMYAEVQLNAEK
jgi:HlyD family secretion protein